MHTLIIFDLNGTLTNTPFIDKQPLALLPGRKEKITQLQAQGITCAIASNQGGVAFGFQTEMEAKAEVGGIAGQLGIQYCSVAFGHPNPKLGYEDYANEYHMRRRKPGPGMLEDLIKAVGTDLDEVLMVGDRDEDKGAAEAAGCAFAWTKDYFQDVEELVGKIYLLARQLADELGRAVTLHLSNEGTGSVGNAYDTYVEWEQIEEAPFRLARALEQAKEQKKVPVKDDFDPFLDANDLP